MTISSYFFREEPKQLFVGAEICARGYLWLKGERSSRAVERIIDYAQGAQAVFAAPNAGKAVVEFWNAPGGAKTVSALAEMVAQCVMCLDFAVNKIFESRAGQPFKAVVFVADIVNDAAALKSAYNNATDSGSIAWQVSTVKTALSLWLSVAFAAVHYGAMREMVRELLVLEAVLFTVKTLDFCIPKSST